MSLISTITRHGRHRAADKVAELERQLQAQRARLVNASTAIRELRQDRRDAIDTADRLRTRICALTVERDQLTEIIAELRAQAAADANAHAITVPPSIRDTSHPADQATEPIKVVTLPQAFGNTSPAHIPPAP